MLFNSWAFCVFFPIVTILYFAVPHRFRWPILLSASCFFYMSFVPKYILILAATIIVDYFAALWIVKTHGRVRQLLFFVSIVVTCLILFFFKYFNFFVLNVNDVAKLLHWNYSLPVLEIILPIGLSFHTFQSLSYVIEVYRGNFKPERHFGIYALYVMFYPQLVAGPIERPQNLLHQFHEKHDFNYQMFTSGLRLIAWGLFKKVVIADRLAQFVNPIFDKPGTFAGLPLLLATAFFTVQIYCDFSGYSDIAIGTARTMGFTLMKNFDRPYTSKTLAEFWKRWHISLSTWLRDYIYEPISLHLRDWGKTGIIVALMTTFLISGLWHGASWNFVFWGLLHGTALSLEMLWAKPRKKLAKVLPSALFDGLSIAFTFCFVSLTYIFFRAKTLGDASYILTHLFKPNQNAYQFLSLRKAHEFLSARTDFYFCLGLMSALLGLEFFMMLKPRLNFDVIIADRPWWVRWPIYQGSVFALVLFGIWFKKQDFIYFQF